MDTLVATSSPIESPVMEPDGGSERILAGLCLGWTKEHACSIIHGDLGFHKGGFVADFEAAPTSLNLIVHCMAVAIRQNMHL